MLLALLLIPTAPARSSKRSYYYMKDFTLGTTWSSCDPESEFNLTSVTVTPDPVKIGKNVTVQCVGTLNTTVTDGKLMLNVSYWLPGIGWVKVPGFPMYWSLCEVSTCPFNSGSYTFTKSLVVPLLTPPGKYQGNVLLTDQGNRTVACLLWATQITT